MPHLVHPDGLRVELIGRLGHDIGRAGDQVVGLEQAVNRGFRHEVVFLFGEAHGQLPKAQLGLLQRCLDDPDFVFSGEVAPGLAPDILYHLFGRGLFRRFFKEVWGFIVVPSSLRRSPNPP